jgi:hypothetical protein
MVGRYKSHENWDWYNNLQQVVSSAMYIAESKEKYLNTF